MTKQRKSIVARHLPTPEEAEQIAAKASGRTQSPKKDKSKIGRPKRKEKRAKFTTAINPGLIKQLKMEAVKRDCQPADILEEVLRDRYKANKK